MKQDNISQNKIQNHHKKILKISWNEYFSRIDNIIKYIKNENIKYKQIYGIPRGGLIPATIISYTLNIPMILCEKKLKSNNIKTLIIDDIYDTGKTLLEYSQINNSNNIVLYSKEKEYKNIIYYDKYIDFNTWIIFPYE